MRVLLTDIRYAVRQLKHTPAFALFASLSLAIGIGGNAAVFSVLDALFLRAPAAVAEPSRLVEVNRTFGSQRFGNQSYPNYADYRDRNQVFDGLAAYKPTSEPFGLSTGDLVDRVNGSSVSGNYFAVLGTRMFLGRGFNADEDRLNAPLPVTVITYGLWQTHFAGDRHVIGRTVRLNNRPFTIVGVTPPGFHGHTMATTDLWIPLSARVIALSSGNDTEATAPISSSRRGVWLLAVGRLKAGVSIEQARSDMTRIARDLEREYPDDNRGVGVALSRALIVPAQVAPIAGVFLALLFALVGLVLLIAVVNVTGMMLTRGAGRTREVAVRLALGGSRNRVIALLLTEPLLIAAIGSAVGVALSYGLIRILRAVIPVLPISVAIDVQIDWRVVIFSVLLAFVVGICCGLVPAYQSSDVDLSSAIKPDGHAKWRRLRLQHTFIVAQVAMSVLLVVVGLLLFRSLRNVDSIDPGFDIRHLDAVTIDLRLGGYSPTRRERFWNELLARVGQVANVERAALSQMIPLTTEAWSNGPVRPAGTAFDIRSAVFPDWNAVSPAYFTTTRIPIVRGRAFTTEDRSNSPAVIIINETLARRLWAGQDPVGQPVIHRHGPPPGADRILQVVGVAKDTKYSTLGEAPQPYVYMPLAQRSSDAPADTSLLVRTNGGSALAGILGVLQDIDRDLPIVRAGRLPELAAFSLLPHRAVTWLAASVGAIGLLLAAIGLYGVSAYNVTRRTREIGIRIAVGAATGQVMRLVIGGTAALTAIGAGIGLLLAAAGGRLLSVFLYGIGPLDAASFAGGALLLTIAAVVASIGPARRMSIRWSR